MFLALRVLPPCIDSSPLSILKSFPTFLILVRTLMAGDDECTLAWFHAIKSSNAVPSNRLPFYLGNPLHIISSLVSQVCLFQDAILHKMLKLGFWNFKLIFLRIEFSLVATFFSLVLVICLSWYLHLTLCHLFLTFISLKIWR